jgi:hypothetical protein
MIHAREDYNRFQDPENKIGQDEPVMLFRAHDIHFIGVLTSYASLLEENGNTEVANAVREHIELASDWRKKHGVKEPDL